MPAILDHDRMLREEDDVITAVARRQGRHRNVVYKWLGEYGLRLDDYRARKAGGPAWYTRC